MHFIFINVFIFSHYPALKVIFGYDIMKKVQIFS
jgi:hypothetical protein